ncbi:hypothetical protein [Arthrobacter sp. TMN-50]
MVQIPGMGSAMSSGYQCRGGHCCDVFAEGIDAYFGDLADPADCISQLGATEWFEHRRVKTAVNAI